MIELWQTLIQLFVILSRLVVELLTLGLHHALLLAWLAWALWGINWKRVWPVLAQGGWAPAVLVLVISALVWSQIAPSQCSCLGLTDVNVPNFWWQLSGMGLLAALTLFCGWLQGVFHWAPAEMSLEPPAPIVHEHHLH